MGSVGDMIFGGGQARNSSQGQSQSSNTSTSTSSNRSAQGAVSTAANKAASQQYGYNQSYAPVAAAMTPALGYTTSAGNAMAALLGLPAGATNFSYAQTPYKPPNLPTSISAPAPSTGLDSLLTMLKGAMATAPSGTTPPPTTTPPTGTIPPTAPPVRPITGGAPAYGGTGGATGGGARFTNGGFPAVLMERREFGGPVQAGRPYVVGEKRPEVFVPQQSGTILPTTQGLDMLKVKRDKPPRGGPITAPPMLPPSPTTPAAPVTPPWQAPTPNASEALNNFSNSAGMNFVLDQGQKAISGASAANGVFNSGATGQALTDYGQNIGKSYLNQYMQSLAGLGQLGLGAGSAMANAGGVTGGSSASAGGSSSTSGSVSSGVSNSTSGGSMTSSNSGSGSQHNKNGIIPAASSLLAAMG